MKKQKIRVVRHETTLNMKPHANESVLMDQQVEDNRVSQEMIVENLVKIIIDLKKLCVLGLESKNVQKSLINEVDEY